MVVREESVGNWGPSLLNALNGIEDPRKPIGGPTPLRLETLGDTDSYRSTAQQL